ncbi:MAG: NADH-quinone oxidoreductase subunit B [Bacteroidota bacterium]|nr:NADH-quinone oxidoreductase subunit B [Bacteroidota bacterium]
MARPVQYNITKKPLETPLGIASAPDGFAGEGFFAARLSDVVGLARKNSIWPLPFATSCCGIEFMALMASHYDLARFGSERVSFSPRQCDLLMVMGTIAKKMAPVVRQVYLQMAEPRWVLAMGACASSGGIFDSYSVLQGIDQIIPVDVYVPGCPPRPEAVLDGFLKVQDLVGSERLRRRNSGEYSELLESYGIQ